MADFFNIKTIDSDEEVDYDQELSDEDENQISKKTKHIKKHKNVNNILNEKFEFHFGDDFEEQNWEINTQVKNDAKGKFSSLSIEERIIDKRKERKKLKKNAKAAESDAGTPQIPAEISNLEKQKKDPDQVDGDESEEDENSSDEDVEDKKDDFFEEPPPQVVHQNFTQMNLSRPLLRAVNELGYLHPTPIQSATIPVALLGKDVCACAATGTGKTAAFILPILERLIFRPKQVRSTRVLILIPTRELAIQVHSVSQSLAKYVGIDICLATGGLQSKTQEVALRKNPDIIVATPGRLIDHLHNTPSFDLQSVEILVLDEADRMLEEHFKDQMDELIRLSPKGRQTMLFSATMTDEVEELASLSLNQPVRLFVDQNTNVAENLYQEFVRIRSNREDDRLAIIAALCNRTFSDHCLVFLQTKKMAHHLRIILGLLGLKVGELHGNLSQLQRLESLEQFKKNEIDVLVATDLAARGLDISGVKSVINFNMPTNIKSYIHRVGRTARAGKSGRSVTLVGEKERKMLKAVVKNSKLPVKNRIIPSEVIEKYKKRIESFEKDIDDINKQEKEEKQLRISEMEMNKAKNMIIHRDEIMSRPPKTWIKPEPKKKVTKREADLLRKEKQIKKETEEETNIRKEQEFFKRQAKNERKPKRLRACPVEDDKKPIKGPSKKKPKLEPKKSTKGFDRELTDTSKKALKEFRTSFIDNTKKTKKLGKFKSKRKFKRR